MPGSPRLGPTQHLVLCALYGEPPQTIQEVAEYLWQCAHEAGWTGSTPANEQPAARAALVRLERRGLVAKHDVQFPEVRWSSTPAGEEALEADGNEAKP